MADCLSRRGFLKGACYGAAAIAAGCGWRSAKDARSAPLKVDAVTRATPPGHSVVSAAATTDAALRKLRADLDARRLTYEQVRAVVRGAILDLDDSKRRLGNVIGYGDWAVIKPNIVTCYGLPFSRYVCHGQVTDLRVVKALVEILIEQGKAKRITIAEGGADWRRLGEEGIDPRQTVDGWTVRWPEFGNLSYVDIVAEANKLKPGIADIVDLDTEEFTRLSVPGGHMAEAEYAIPNTILRCDKLISVAALKTNNFAGVTLAAKNFIGIAPAGIYGYDRITKERLPHDAINEVIADLFSFRPPSYAVIEGFRGMEGYGPIWGDELAHNIVLVGGDAVACDAVASAIMGYNPWDIGALHNLADKQLGVNDLRRIYVKGNEINALRRPFKKSPKEHPYARFNLDGYYGRGNRTWLVHGPHPAAALPQNGLEHDFLGGEAGARPKLGAPQWERLCSKHHDYIDLKKHFGDKAKHAVVYVFCQVRSDARRPCDLLIGNDKPVKVWLNGQIVLFDREPKRFSYLQNRMRVELREGINTLLLKAANTAGDFGFSTGLADEDGNTPAGIEYLI